MSAADVVLRDALQNRSFAGLFPYASNVPMKVFAGNEPAVPVSVLVDALDTLQAGQAPRGAAKQMQYAAAVRPSECHTACHRSLEMCMQNGGDQSSCMSSANSCAAHCPLPQ